MAEEPKKQFDPDATVALPAAEPDPDATVALPVAAPDPDATLNGPLVRPEPDPDATFTGAGPKKSAAFDPDATVNPAERLNLDPDATGRIPSPGKLRRNPFAPKSTPDSIQANLSALGGLNQLVALANPILGAVPQIRCTLRHPDPAALRASLHDQIDSLQTTANFAEFSDAAVQSAVYALCALLDESAAATPWGRTWNDHSLLKEVCGESGGGEGFFARLEALSRDPDPDNAENADLLEFYDVCLALGFEGRYRNAEGGRQSLNEIRDRSYALIARRRPRPDELSARWRSVIQEAAAAPALQMAAQVSAQISARQAAAGTEATLPPAAQTSFLSRVPRRAVWSALAGVVGASIAFYMLALRLLDDEVKTALTSSVRIKAGATKSGAPVAAVPAATPATAASAALAKVLEGQAVSVTEAAGRISIALRHERQFPVGSVRPAGELRPLLEKIAAALDEIPGAITVTGHADATPAGGRRASNLELSVARARAAAQIMAPKLGMPGRLSAEGKGDTEPLAPGKTAADLARNRRITISVTPGA